ncbi:MAG: deoxyguanosinetriphosphate triphosphohydrolase [Thermoleophilia bacterium]|nr:deoxyguanosinetriphosphate triphosphohydrolase [Thermoleophilia bacterium]
MSVASGKVADRFHEAMREREAENLSEFAARSYCTAGRLDPEEPEQCSVRSAFQIDRDRILHTKSFRRLMSKTQVYIAPEGDHYRTRLTHTLEVTAIARTVARALSLNEDLVEAIGLGHDLGHPAFGHTGEHALDEALRERFGLRFHHNEQSLRVVDHLERDGRGLNLTAEVRDGILNHTGDTDPATLEGKIVKIVDRVAYINHDIDDAIRAGILRREELPGQAILLLGETGSQRIDRLVHDLIEASADAGDIVQGDRIGPAMNDLRSFMFEHVYLNDDNNADKQRVSELLPRLLDWYVEHPDQLPMLPGADARGDDLPRRITDWIAGMTDRYCLRVIEDTFLPKRFRFAR